MPRLYTPIKRYDENAGETYNSRLRQLEAGYDSVGNVHELIDSDTLTTPVLAGFPLNISLQGVRWRWLRFTGAFYSNVSSATPVGCLMRFNEDPSALYDLQQTLITGTSIGGGRDLSTTFFQLYYGTTSHGYIDLLIKPDTTGALILGSAAVKPDAGSMRNYLWALQWRGTAAATSFQLIPTGGFVAGSYWRLEGMRA